MMLGTVPNFFLTAPSSATVALSAVAVLAGFIRGIVLLRVHLEWEMARYVLDVLDWWFLTLNVIGNPANGTRVTLRFATPRS